MIEMLGKTREDWIGELEREIHFRQKVYTNLVASHRMNARQAAWRIDTLQDLLNHLKGNPTWQPNSPMKPSGATTHGATD